MLRLSRGVWSFTALVILLVVVCQPADGMSRAFSVLKSAPGPIARRLTGGLTMGSNTGAKPIFNMRSASFSSSTYKPQAPLAGSTVNTNTQGPTFQFPEEEPDPQPKPTPMPQLRATLASMPKVAKQKTGGIYSYKMGDMNVGKVCDCAQEGEVWKIGMSTNLEQRLANAGQKTKNLAGVDTQYIRDARAAGGDTTANLFANSESSAPIPLLRVPGTGKDIRDKEGELHDAIAAVAGVQPLEKATAIDFLAQQCQLGKPEATSILKKIGGFTELFFVPKNIIAEIQSMIQTCKNTDSGTFSVDCIIEGLKKMHDK